MGAFAGTLNNGVGSASISSPLTYSGGVVNLTALNSLAQACRNTTLAGCIPGTVNNCTYPSNSYIGLSHVDGGGGDTANPCSQQGAWGYSGPGAQATIQPTQGHTALYYENFTGDGDCGTSAYTDQQSICPNSYAYLHLVAMLANLHVYGNVSSAGITGAGIH